jgi:hypothetical protein
LDICKKAFDDKQKKPSAIDLHKKLVAEVKPEFHPRQMIGL